VIPTVSAFLPVVAFLADSPPVSVILTANPSSKEYTVTDRTDQATTIQRDRDGGVILVIDDDAVIRKVLGGAVEDLGYGVLSAENGDRGMELYTAHRPDLVFLDLKMPGRHGIDVLKQIRETDHDTPVIVISGQGTTDDVVAALKFGAWDFLLKPFDFGILGHEISRCFEKGRLIRENRQRMAQLTEANDRLRKAIEDANGARKSAEKANQTKNDFVARMSNELRIPAMGIESMVDILIDTGLTREQLYIAKVIQSSIASVNESLGTLLDFSRMDSRRFTLEKVNFSLETLIGDVLARIHRHATGDSVNFSYAIHPDVPGYLVGDPWRVGQLLSIFLENAFRCTEQGEVRISISRESLDDSAATLRFDVADAGTGVNQEALSSLFDAFRRTGDQSAGVSSAGLGLLLARRLASLMDGRIGVHSDVGKGSVFWFTVKLGVQHDNPRDDTDIGREFRTPEAMAPRNLNVLVADGNEDMQVITGAFLKRIGCGFSTARNSTEMLEKLEEVDFDLLLLDMGLEEMNGYEVAGVIRSAISAVKNHAIPIIGMSDENQTEVKTRCRQIGICQTMPRPFTFQQLISAMEALPLKNHPR